MPDLADRFGDVFASLADEAKQTIADLNAAGLNPQGINPMVAVQTGRFHSADDAGNVDGQYSDNLAFADAFPVVFWLRTACRPIAELCHHAQ